MRDFPSHVSRSIRHYDYARNPLDSVAIDRATYLSAVREAGKSRLLGRDQSRGYRVAQLPSALDVAFRYDTKVIVEEGIEGREIECAVLGNDEPVASIPGEIVVTHADGFYSYDAKYIDDGAKLEIPAELNTHQVREVQQLSSEAFRVLECSGLARVDFFLASDGQWFVNEINTLPGFTAISMYPKLWAASGVQPRELITRLIDLALTRNVKRKALRTLPSLRRAQATRGVCVRPTGSLAMAQSVREEAHPDYRQSGQLAQFSAFPPFLLNPNPDTAVTSGWHGANCQLRIRVECDERLKSAVHRT